MIVGGLKAICRHHKLMFHALNGSMDLNDVGRWPFAGLDNEALFIFDIETDGLPDQRAPGNTKWAQLPVTVAVGYDAVGTRHDFVFPPGDGETEHMVRAQALEALASRLDAARVLVAFNGRGFDLRVLGARVAPDRWDAWLKKLVDPFEAIRELTGSWVKLDELLLANGLPSKGSNGADAMEWWKAGECARVLEYCAHDARLLAQVVGLETIRFPVKRWVQVPGCQGRREQRVEAWKRMRWSVIMSHALRCGGEHASKRLRSG